MACLNSFVQKGPSREQLEPRVVTIQPADEDDGKLTWSVDSFIQFICVLRMYIANSCDSSLKHENLCRSDYFEEHWYAM
jgi:hypothetical protein